jgi:hypothetical protein
MAANDPCFAFVGMVEANDDQPSTVALSHHAAQIALNGIGAYNKHGLRLFYF